MQRRTDAHEEKHEAHRNEPDAYDHEGVLEGICSRKAPEVRQRIIGSRMRHAEHEITTFQDQIDELTGGT